MNGVRLLLLFAAAFQLGAGSGYAQVADPFPTDPSRDFGWQIKDGVLEYIVQISPEKALFMQQNGEENLSDMPPELVGRVQRIVVRVGNDILPKSPSKEEIKRTVPLYMTPNDVTASLGAGKFSDVESNSVVNVQGAGRPYPDFPRGTGGQGNLPATLSPGSAAGQSQNSLAERFLSDSMAPAPTTQVPSTIPDPRALPQTGSPGLLAAGTNKFSNTAPNGAGAPANPGVNPNGNWPGSTNAANNPGGLPASGNNLPAMQSLGTPNGAQEYSPPPIAGGASGLGSENALSQQAPSRWGSAPGVTTPGGRQPPGNNFVPGTGNSQYAVGPGGSAPAGQGQSMPGFGGNGYNGSGYGGNGYGRGGYGGGGYGSGGFARNPNSNPQDVRRGLSGGDGVTRLAMNPNGSDAGAGNGNDPGTDGVQPPGGSPSDNADRAGGANSGRPAQKTGDVWLQIFFLVSLIVNFYLGMLIRKLLSRYRSLLSNVRGQAA